MVLAKVCGNCFRRFLPSNITACFCNRKLEILRTGWRQWSLTVKALVLLSVTFTKHDLQCRISLHQWLWQFLPHSSHSQGSPRPRPPAATSISEIRRRLPNLDHQVGTNTSQLHFGCSERKLCFFSKPAHSASNKFEDRFSFLINI